jgi:FAD/FMN-containing dehydrogenase
VDVITADGRLLRASAEEKADLFWGVRGGGGNFEAVTSFEYTLHAVGPMLVAGVMFHHGSKTRKILKFYSQYSRSAPDELGSLAILTTAPPAPPFAQVDPRRTPLLEYCCVTQVP